MNSSKQFKENWIELIINKHDLLVIFPVRTIE